MISLAVRQLWLGLYSLRGGEFRFGFVVVPAGLRVLGGGLVKWLD